MTPHEHCSGHDHDYFDKRFNDAEKWAKKFDDPVRAEWQKPERTIEALAIEDNQSIADIGAGTGYFTIRIAKHYPKTKILAVDVEPDMVAYIENRAKSEGLTNVKTLLVQPKEEIKLPEPVDKILIINTYHHIPDRIHYFKSLSSCLKENGSLIVIDFKLDSPEGPPVEHRIQPDQIQEELRKSGLEKINSMDFLPYQFFLEFKKLKSSTR